MTRMNRAKMLRGALLTALFALVCTTAVPAVKNMAVVVSAGSKLADVSLTDLNKYCRGTAKAWPDGKTFVIVLKNPDAPEMHAALQKLFGGVGGEAKAAIAKLNESRMVVKVVDTDEDLLHTVDITPGAVGIIDVYAINSSVKVLRVDGKLPFDMGYALKGN
jgi:uncharacterized cupredoxin-like copper-binding protein